MSAAVAGLNAAGDALRRGFRWWGQGLAMALPASMLALVLGDRRSVHLEADETGGLTARLTPTPFAAKVLAEAPLNGAPGHHGAALKIIRAAARSRPVAFTPPPDLVLTQEVTVPEAALENLRQAVSFGISTWTPFDADMLVHHADVVGRRGEQARVRIRMVLRDALEPFLETARDAGVPIRLVAFDRNLQGCAELGEQAKRASAAKKIDLALLSSAVALACALLGTLHLQWSSELDRLDAGIRAEIAQQAKQRAVEQKLAEMGERRRAVLTKRAVEPRLADIVASVGNALPETAEVSEFTWAAAQGRIVASKAAAPEIKAAFDGAGMAIVSGPTTVGGDRVAFEFALRKPAP